jgi:hypothetical protein
MATLGNQAESRRIVEPATQEVQRTAHTDIASGNPMTYGTSAGTKFEADNYSTTNYATPQGEKLLTDIQLDKGVKLAKGGEGETAGHDHVPEEQIVDGNPKVKMASDVPGLVVSDAPLTADDIRDVNKIGGGAHESKEINGIPITPQIAAEVRRAEDKAGHDTGKGSVAARVQSAAAFNVREGVVPPVGTADIGTTRGVIINDRASQKQSMQRIQQGTITHSPGGGV